MRKKILFFAGILFLVTLGRATGQVDSKQTLLSKPGAEEEFYKKSLNRLNDNPLLDQYDVKFYKIDVEVSNLSDYINGEVTILVEVVENSLSTLVFELINQLEVESVYVNNELLTFSHKENEININVNSPANKGSLLSTRIKYSGYTGGGMFSSVDNNWNIPITATLSEPFYAKDWFPCKEVLPDKADSVYVFITTENGLKGVSNGLNTGTSYLPNGKIRHEWKSNYPITFYLISLAVANYTEYTIDANPAGSTKPLMIQNFVYNVPNCLDFYKNDIDQTIDIMELFADLFGPYPFQEEKYGHYLWTWGGGMEHQTMTGMGNFNFGLIAHELGHSWFGNYVTCATWSDIWINEGFASYAAYLATENLRPDGAAAELFNSFDRAMRELDGTVYIPEEDAVSDGRIFSSNLSYRKGMALLHMIRFELQDDDLFFEVLKEFLQEYAFSVARGVDFKEVLEDVSGMDFTDFFDQWYFGAGFPIYSLTWQQVGTIVTINSLQETSSDETPLFKMPIEFELQFSDGDTIVSGYHNMNEELFVFNVNKTVEKVVIDPDNWVLNGLGTVQELVGIDQEKIVHTLYPNPNNGQFSIILPEAYEGRVYLEVYNSVNQLIKAESIKDFHSGIPMKMNIESPIPGIYFIRIHSDSFNEVSKMIIE
jgi:aminopeptidase N